MAIICPTITTTSQRQYLNQLSVALSFSSRIHIDLADDSLSSRPLLSLDKISWPKKAMVDLHIMAHDPDSIMRRAIDLKPNLIIIHSDNLVELEPLITNLRLHNIKVGIALSKDVTADKVPLNLSLVDHVMLFSGNLGYQGGSTADLSLLSQINWLKTSNSRLEIGWDGGVNDLNIDELVRGGVDVINVGSFIQLSSNPVKAYAKLMDKII